MRVNIIKYSVKGGEAALGSIVEERAMKQMSLRKGIIAASTIACGTLLSLGWSEQSGVSLSVDSAQARVGRPYTPVSVAGHYRRQARRTAGVYGGGGYYGAGVYRRQARRAAIATGAVGTGVYGGGAYYGGGGYVGGGPYWGGGYGPGPVAAATAGAVATAGAIAAAPFGGPGYYGGGYGGGPYGGYGTWAAYAAVNGLKCQPGTLTKMEDGHMYLCQ
jgi:hypothetical protein